MINPHAAGTPRVALVPDGLRIPEVGHRAAVAAPVEAFSSSDRIEVWLVPLPPSTVGAREPSSRPRAPALIVAVAGLSILGLPTAADAAPATPVPAAPVVAPAPQSPTVVPVQQATAPAPITDARPEAPPPPTSPLPPPIDDGTRRQALDAAWAGAAGRNVVMELVGGATARGFVAAVQEDTFTLVDLHTTGEIRVLRKAAVVSLRIDVRAAVALPRNEGTGLLVGGGILLAVGAPVFVTGVVFLGLMPSVTFLHLPMILAGGGALAGGAAMIAVGAKRRRSFQEAMFQRTALTPSVGRTRLGTWTGGLTLRF